ncbi:hypothetical protein [Chryseobacterium camelliae]|uniref:Formate hydrogenlyase subunit 3/multisubunit Na+/H+ antiporter MnhD subunit n=1 Tax=Chryseobacterium camelliae TaxID=1265445 RepID=A0ABU0TKN9_9FLAO|nr:hypothetical protein [Chryseobacterium camelliae]MDQ1101547.1 formate hydrogenlyase subunit 3/multisubunit Na+/H+ antiporter MnhD subunit [Chryseobacterium sp. SORGH_AS_1048]MDR6084990.1 formate hydrogenlyase subunit 3/multisubunit Na+/H+ antiporter MnhD subunit [Chryseobacterium sp. SORGH_AS_0909]MDR6129344.1 formate hydrogenlyase subunit 3/multisubunit Na+/H+ antiporter MnhD subunit [Chryseobacterium sp. SORGH_AS_1175]MDT3408527.1 formate hydrogenlyase subunit 3/multisubunit Na+/H+ antipor
MIFNTVLIIHFSAFLIFLMMLTQLFFQEKKILNKHSIIVGAVILLTGILLSVLRYPHINYYKIIPKSVLFILISVFCAIYSKKPVPDKVHYLLFLFTFLASLIAVYKS